MKLMETRLFVGTNIDTGSISINQYPDQFTIANEGEKSTYIGIILKGKILVKAYSLGGRDFTINTLNEGMIFGDILLFGNHGNIYPGNLTTKGIVELAIIPNERIKEFLDNKVFLRNFLTLLSDKVYQLNHKNKILSQDTIRDKVITYLTEEQRIQKSNRILIGMSKEDLANHLFIPRPSLSRELIHMKAEGLIEYDRYTITLTGLLER